MGNISSIGSIASSKLLLNQNNEKCLTEEQEANILNVLKGPLENQTCLLYLKKYNCAPNGNNYDEDHPLDPCKIKKIHSLIQMKEFFAF